MIMSHKVINKGCEEKMQFRIAQTVNDWALGANKVNDASFISIKLATVKAVIWWSAGKS